MSPKEIERSKEIRKDVCTSKGHGKGRVVTQVSACLIAALGNLSAVSVYAWTALTLPSMKEDPDLALSTADVAWIASIVSIGCMLGSFFTGMAMDWLGRRTLLMVTAPFLSAGWVTVALAPNTEIILLGRAICGIASAFVMSALLVYCTEVSEARLRGRLGTIPSQFMTLGFLFAYIAGMFFSWRISCYICLSPLIIMFVALWAVPESPYWYLLKGRDEDCEAALRWLRGPNYNVSTEITEMKAKLDSVGNKVEIRELWRPRTSTPILISSFMSIAQQWCGASVIMTFAGMIFISSGLETPNLATLMVGIVHVVFALVSVLAADYVGRRLLFIASILITGIATIFLGLYYLMTNILGIFWPTWIPLASVLAVIAGFSIGARTIPSLLSAELISTKMRSTASSIYFFQNRLMGFITVQIYPFFEEAYGPHVVFLTFGSLSLFFSVVSVFVVPETKGKTLEQIQEYFESPKTNKESRVHPLKEIPMDANLDICVLNSYKSTK